MNHCRALLAVALHPSSIHLEVVAVPVRVHACVCARVPRFVKHIGDLYVKAATDAKEAWVDEVVVSPPA